MASDSEGPDQNQLERLEEVTEEMVRQNLLGVTEVSYSTYNSIIYHNVLLSFIHLDIYLFLIKF